MAGSVSSGKGFLDAYGTGGLTSNMPLASPYGTSGMPMSMTFGGSSNPFSVGGSRLPQVVQSGQQMPQVTSIPGPPPMASTPITMMAPGSLPPRTLPVASWTSPPSQTFMYSASSLGTSSHMRPPPSIIQAPVQYMPQGPIDNARRYDTVVRPEAEQGSLMDFCVHSQAQEELQEEWYHDVGIDELPANPLQSVEDALTRGMSRLEFEDDEGPKPKRPYGMSMEQHEEYKVKLQAFKKCEKPAEHKVEIHHVEKAHQHVEYAKAGRLEKDLLHLREDQLERRLGMLEQIAAAAPQNRQRGSLYSEDEPQQQADLRQGVSPFMEKFLPVPIGGGMNWHYFNHSQGYYIQRSKIAQREAQLRHLQDQHQHEMIYALAGKNREEISDDYWVRDHRSWLKEATRPENQRRTNGNSSSAQNQYMMNPFG